MAWNPRRCASAFAASNAWMLLATMTLFTRAKRGSSGFGVSGILPAAPASRWARTLAGISCRRLYLSTMAKASA